MIRFQQVSKHFPAADGRPAVAAVRELELEVRAGETLALIGTSGCGKTTLLRLINRLERPSAGWITVEGRDLAEADPVRLRRGMGYVLQHGGLFPHLTVTGNVELLLELEGWERSRRAARSDALLEAVRLDPKIYRGRFPSELSGGERQRVGVARALALDPPILLMDEPFGALDPITRRALQLEFLELDGRTQRTVVLVTHDLSEAFLLADRVALLDAGRLVQVGREDELRETPRNEFVRSFLEAQGLARQGTGGRPRA